MNEACDICLIAPGHVASTPRLVKSADALAAAGYRVHVVCGRTFPPADPFDAAIFARAGWSHEQVQGSGPGGRLLSRLARLAVGRMPAASIALAARAVSAHSRRLAATAARTPARLYFGHCLGGLPAAAFAARRHRRPYGFDAEDFHGTETEAMLGDRAEQAAIRTLQSRLLPGCAAFTTASPLIGERYARDYGVRPRVILNVFPLTEAPASYLDAEPITAQRPARFYWFSQTVGPGRGLEATVAILGRMRTPAELQLRGFPVAGYAEALQAQAAAAGFTGPIRFLPPGPASEMARLAAAADLGLSTEESSPPNRDLCLTNKVFAYLLAGIPQLLSATAAQAALAPELGAAALLGQLGDPTTTARQVDAFLADPARIGVARRTAQDLARHRFCWDLEQHVLLERVRAALAASP